MSPRPSPARLSRAIALCAAALLALGGCAQRPVADSFVTRPQPVLQSAQHWQIVAQDLAAAISTYVQRRTGKNDPVSVYMMRGGDTLFGDAFISAVTTGLVQQGHAVALDPRPDVTAVGIDMTVVPWRGVESPASVPGLFSTLGAGVALGKYLTDQFPWGVTAVAAGVGIDVLRTLPQETDTELMLTVSVAEQGFITFRTSAVYYIHGADLWHYADRNGLVVFRNLNDLPTAAIAYDLARRPYIIDNR